MKLDARVGRYSIAFCYGLLLAFLPILASESPSFFGRMLNKGSRLQQKMKGLTAKLFGAPKNPATYQVLDTVPVQVYKSPPRPVPIKFNPVPAGADFRQPVPSPHQDEPAPYHGAPGPLEPDNMQPIEYRSNPDTAPEVDKDDEETEFHDANDHFEEEENDDAADGHHHDSDNQHEQDSQGGRDGEDNHDDYDGHNHQNNHDDHDGHIDRDNRLNFQHHSQTDHDDEHDREHGQVRDEDHPYEGANVNLGPVHDEEEPDGHHEANFEPYDGNHLHSQPMSPSSDYPVNHPQRTEEDNNNEKFMVAKQPLVKNHEDDLDDGAVYDHQRVLKSDEGDEDVVEENLHPDELERQPDFQEQSETRKVFNPHQNGYQEPGSTFDDHGEANGDHVNYEDFDGAKPLKHQKDDDSIALQLNGHSQSNQDKFDTPDDDEHDHVDSIQSSRDDRDVVDPIPIQQIQTLSPEDPQRPGTDPKLRGRQFNKRKRSRSEVVGDEGSKLKPVDDFDIRNWLNPTKTEINPIYKQAEEEEARRKASLVSEFQDEDDFANVGPEMDDLDNFDEQLIPVDTFEVVEKYIDDPSTESEFVNGEEPPKVDERQPSADELESLDGNHAVEVSQPQDSESVEEPSAARLLEPKQTDDEVTRPSKEDRSEVVEKLENDRQADLSSFDEETKDELELKELEPVADNFVDDQELPSVERPKSFDEEAMKVSRARKSNPVRGDGADMMERPTKTLVVDGDTLQTPSISAALIPDEKASGIGLEFAEPAKVMPEASSSKIRSPPEVLDSQEEVSPHEKKESEDVGISEKHIEKKPGESALALDETHLLELTDDDNDSNSLDEPFDRQEHNGELSEEDESVHFATENETHSLNDDNEDDESSEDIGSDEDSSSLIQAQNDAPDFDESDNRVVHPIHGLPREDETKNSATNEESHSSDDNKDRPTNKEDIEPQSGQFEESEPLSHTSMVEDQPDLDSSPGARRLIEKQSFEKAEQPVQDYELVESAGHKASAPNEDGEQADTSESLQDDASKDQLVNAVQEDKSHQVDEPADEMGHNVPRLNRGDSFLGRELELRDQTEETQLDHNENDQIVEDESQDGDSNDSMASSEEIKAELALVPLPPMLDAKGLEMTKKRRFKNYYKLNTNRNRIPKLNHRLSIETDDWNPVRELIARREGRRVKGSEDSTGTSQRLSKNSGQLAEIVASTFGNKRIETIAYKSRQLGRGQ